MKRKTIVMNVDYFDELSLHKDPMGPEDVETLVRQCAESGVDTLFWRAIGLGIAGYPSRLVGSASWAEGADYALAAGRTEEGSPYSGLKKKGEPWGGKLTASLARMDPIATARDACRRHGLFFFIWMDPIDEMRNRFLLDHPECLVTGRDGKTLWPGLRSYANWAAVANQLEVVEELLGYRPDGLYMSTSCHTRHLQFPEPADFFGFEPPVVESYRNRVGRGIDEGVFDAETWHQIKGDGFTEFFRAVKKLLAPMNAKLALGTPFGPNMIFTCPTFSQHVPYRYAVQWKRWVDEGIADILILGDYEWTWDFHPICEAKKIPIVKGRYAADLMTREYVDYTGGRAELYYFSSWLSAYAQKHQGASSESIAGALQMRSATIREQGADGICLHEAHTFEYYNAFETVVEMRKLLDA